MKAQHLIMEIHHIGRKRGRLVVRADSLRSVRYGARRI
jgi:hypothetical protein